MKPLNPNNYSLEDYRCELTNLNLERVLATQERLESASFTSSIASIVQILGGVSDNLHIYPMLVGSDGRLEKGAHSPDDLMIYIAGSNLSRRILKPLSGWLTNEFPKGNGDNIEQVEPKLLDLSLVYFYEDRSNPRPGRILDAREVNPEDADAVRLTKSRLYEELINGDSGRSVLSEVSKKESERRTTARKLVNRGIQNARGNVLYHVDYASGTAFFDPKRGESVFAVSSFKQGFLRLMQTELLQATLIHAGKCETKQAISFVGNIPANTLERIDYLVDWKVFDPRVFSARRIAELKDNYSYFVQQYHRSEYAYVTEKRTTVDFDKAEVQNRKADVLSFDEALGKQFAKMSRPG